MFLSYFDESGDQGQHGGSVTYTLGGVVVRDSDWPDLFDDLLSFRRSLRDKYGLLLRHEVKANYLIRGSGDISGLDLSPSQRSDVWKAHFDFLARHSDAVKVYAVVIHKERIKSWRNPREISWEYALQRLKQIADQEDETVMIIHDEGDDLATRQLIRKARRLSTPGSAFGTGRLGNQPIRRIIDDPVPRNSQHSYFIQLADLVAYAAYRTVVAPGASVGRICSADMWDRLEEAQWAAANSLARTNLGRADKQGVVVWPK